MSSTPHQDRRQREQRRYRSSDQNQQDDPEHRPYGAQGQGQREEREERERRRREDQGRHAGQDRRRESQGGGGRPSSDRSQSRPQHQHDAAQRTDWNRVHREDPIPISLDRYNPDRPYDGRQGGSREHNSFVSHGAGPGSYRRDRPFGRGSDFHRGGHPSRGQGAWGVSRPSTVPQKRTDTAAVSTGGMGQGRSQKSPRLGRREDRSGGAKWGLPRPRSVPLPRRPWTVYDTAGQPYAIEDPKAAKGGDWLTVMCWNILAQSLIDFSYMPYCNRTEMAWDNRLTGILEVIREQQPDLLCMQEDDMHEELSTELAELGYSATHKKRTSADKKDGCSIFWKTSAGLQMVEVVEVEYKRQVGHMDRDNVAVCAVLEDRQGRRLVLANTHLLFNPKRGDVKLAQAQCLVSSVEELVKRQPPSATVGIVLCGDFNCTPMSAVYQFLSAGSLEVSGLNRTTLSGQTLVDPRNHMVAYSDAWTYRPGNVSQARHQGSGTAWGQYRAPAQPNTQVVKPAEPQKQGRGEATKRRGAEDEGALIAVTQTTEQGSMFSTGTGGDVSEVRDTILVMATADSESEMQQLEGSKTVDAGASQSEDIVHEGGPTALPRHTPASPWPSINLHVSPTNQPPIRHNLQLASAYAQRPDGDTSGEPAFTTFHKSFKGCVDFMWYDSGGLRCLGVLEMPLLNQLVERQGLPCLGNPSDHLPLLARFQFKDESQQSSV